MRRRPEGRPRSESVHCKRSLGGMSRADVSWGPRFSSTAPAQHPHPLLHQISPWAGRSVEANAEPRCDACGRTFQIGPNTQVRTVRKRRTRRGDATAARGSAQVGIVYTVNAR